MFFSLGPLACIAGVKWGRGRGGVETEEEGDVGGRSRDGRRNTLFPLSNSFLTSPFPSPFTPFTPRDNIKKKDHIISHVVWSCYG